MANVRTFWALVLLLIPQVWIQPQTSNFACSYNARTLVLLFTANRLSVAMPSQDCAYDISSVAIHNLFTAHTADQVSQYTISSQRTRQIKCRNIQSLHCAHGRSSVTIYNLFTAHTADQVSQYTISALRTWWAQRSYAFTVMNVLYLSPLIASLESLSFASRENSS